MFFLQVLFDFRYFLFCLDDESKYSALCNAEHFWCSVVVARVPAPYVSVGVTTASKRCNRCRSKLDWGVSACRCLANADQAHRIPCCTRWRIDATRNPPARTAASCLTCVNIRNLVTLRSFHMPHCVRRENQLRVPTTALCRPPRPAEGTWCSFLRRTASQASLLSVSVALHPLRHCFEQRHTQTSTESKNDDATVQNCYSRHTLQLTA